MNNNNTEQKGIMKEILKGYIPLRNDILETKKVCSVDPEYYELTAELLGALLDKTVWLSVKKNEEVRSNDDKEYLVKKNDLFNINKFLNLGYERVERVWNEGEISILGDVVVIWPFSMGNLVRFSMLGEKIESIDIVEVSTRKKIKSVESRMFLDSSSNLLVGNEDKEDSVNLEIVSNIGEGSEGIELGIRKIPGIENFVSRRGVLEIVKNYKNRGYSVLYLTKNTDKYDIEVEDDLKDCIDNIYIEKEFFGEIFERGFVSSVAKILVLTDLEVLGEIDLSSFQMKNLDMDPSSVDILKKILPGDYVVHEDHGIGKYIEIQKKENGYYMEIAYAGKDRLYVPLTASEKLTKYIGAGRAKPILTGLNSGIWKRISQKAKDRAEEIAKELLQLYALRETQEIDTVLGSSDLLNDFEIFVKQFLFEDTDDQLLATRHIIEDFQKKKPMDRLLVGDVGYGKTEIAMRAMFAVANAGYQVAFLAPTTILVEQHLAVLKERFKNYPINIVSVSRFLTPKEKENIVTEIERGSVDIVVGTHALLSDDIKFKNLGLLVIDEEQKFGVKQKEKIKSKRLSCNVLSLTATPIPRTLNMALLGIRDISVLATPPSGRKEVVNRFERFDWNSIEDAIKKELDRGGQVYFLHNRVDTIEAVCSRLIKMFPHCKIGIAHGQMNVQILSSNMANFTSGKLDILVCTTIIENGLDIPSVNTLIIDDSTMLGLSQMYQIRGRIGRSKVQAYAYFYYESLKGDSKLRLEALKNSQELGSGFLLSNKDLEIRGAGDILGMNQSGAINSVGYGLYSQMLNEAVRKLKGMGK